MIETECFRVAQEALTNVVRHAKAQTVVVELRQEPGNSTCGCATMGSGLRWPLSGQGGARRQPGSAEHGRARGTRGRTA